MRRWPFVLLALFLVSAGMLAWATGAGPLGLDCGDFDSEEWKETDPLERDQLADLLIECDTLIGLRRDQTIELLGKPDYGPIGNVKPGRGANWVVGEAFIDTALLSVGFDQPGPRGRVRWAKRAVLG